MEFKKLPVLDKNKHMDFPYFPDRFHAAVFRLWETCGKDKLARALSVSPDVIDKAAKAMGLREPQCIEKWEKRGYISIIRSAWHILPYNQLLKLLDWSEDKLAKILAEEDFFDVKMGYFKPYCEEVVPEELTEEGKEKLNRIKNIMDTYFAGMLEGAVPFDFFNNKNKEGVMNDGDGLRLIYSYCGLYVGALDNDISVSYPDKILRMYKETGVNAVWIPVILYEMCPFPFDESYSVGWEKRRERLKELVNKAKEYGIKIYLYLNEPRCMPLHFFEKHPELMGNIQATYGSMCTSVPVVMEYLRNSVRSLCEAVPEIGGFFTITCSEYLTHCKSRKDATECERCKDVPIYKLVSDVITAISEESRKVNPDINTIAWAWAWDAYMTDEERKKCIDLIPEDVIIQCNSEIAKEFTIGGVKGKIEDYSISIPGPGEYSQDMWKYAQEKGHRTSAKVQVNASWECSTVPFMPVFDLVREHMTGLKNAGVENIMLSWTLGGYPSITLKIVSECLKDPDENKYIELLEKEYGEDALKIKEAATVFSEAFRNFPFHCQTLYQGPQNAGPSTPLYLKPTGFSATMTCYAYDDLESWRATYPADVFINQFKKVSDVWEKGLDIIKDIKECDFKQVAYATYAIFKSSYNQSLFVNIRETASKEELSKIVENEKEMAIMLYNVMTKNSLVGYEAANHYYYTKSMLAEKVLNCDYILSEISKR